LQGNITNSLLNAQALSYSGLFVFVTPRALTRTERARALNSNRARASHVKRQTQNITMCSQGTHTHTRSFLVDGV